MLQNVHKCVSILLGAISVAVIVDMYWYQMVTAVLQVSTAIASFNPIDAFSHYWWLFGSRYL